MFPTAKIPHKPCNRVAYSLMLIAWGPRYRYLCSALNPYSRTSMSEPTASILLSNTGLAPTPNRILVLKSLLADERPKSLTDIETELVTLHKSSIQRVLTLLLEHGLVHAMEDGRGVVLYELCHRHETAGEEDDAGAPHSDLHPHFYCEVCHRTYCFHEIGMPEIALPEGFEARSVNYMIKGVCPRCSKS